ncbi:MAG TPA: HEAT repeat domain-containing protein [Terriglobia bacterium]|nr:HEAT repeat domain-containing protein [Terriglobia bacterium]
MTYYCPSCWAEIPDGARCPACGADVQRLAQETYEEKLIRSLHHPEPTVPVRAATILGDLRSKSAVDALIEAAMSSQDPYLQEAAVQALGSIGDARALPCLERLSREGAVRVRIAARRAMGITRDANQSK